MDILTAQRALAQGKSLTDLTLRVAFYSRVSTEKDLQIESLGNQNQFFGEFINGIGNWTFAGEYIDNGKSGTNMNRPEFNRLIADAKRGKFDLVLTKEASRWSRNIVDAISVIRDQIGRAHV